MDKAEKLVEALDELKKIAEKVASKDGHSCDEEGTIDARKYGREIPFLFDMHRAARVLPPKIFAIELMNAKSLHASYVEAAGRLGQDKDEFKEAFKRFKKVCKEAQNALELHLENWDKVVEIIEKQEEEFSGE